MEDVRVGICFDRDRVSDVDIRYDMGTDGADPLLGRWAPNLTLRTERGTTRIADLMREGKGLLLDVGGRPELRDIAARWGHRANTITAGCYERPANLDALLIRPDGYVAWVAGADDGGTSQRGLQAALERWFGVGQF